MDYSLRLPDDKFNKYLSWAVGAHAALALAIVSIHWLLGWDFFASRFYTVEKIQPSVRVDIVAMPKFTVQELKQLKIEPSPAAPEDKEGETKPEEKKEAPAPKVDLGNILNTLSKKEVTPKTAPPKAVKGPAINTQALKTLVLEGNKVSRGSTVVGDAYSKEQTEFGAYVGSLPDFIRPHWKLPSYLLENKSLSCHIKVFIDSNGRIMRSEIVKPSGEPEYDRMAQQALSASTFPAPAREILAKVSGGGVILAFPL